MVRSLSFHYSSSCSTKSGGKGVPIVVLLPSGVTDNSFDVAHAGVENVEGVGGGVTFREQDESEADEVDDVDDTDIDFECVTRDIVGMGSATFLSSTQNVEEFTIDLSGVGEYDSPVHSADNSSPWSSLLWDSIVPLT